MNANDVLDMIGDAKGAYIWEAQKHRGRESQPQSRGLSLNKTFLIAAIIALMLLLVGCAVVYVLSLQDMAFGKEVQEYYDGSSQEVTLLSIQGIEGTPGYQATKEWYEWLQTYDTDKAIYHSEEAFSEDFGDDYYAYNLYSREMKDKLDEICAKYDLELLGKMYVDPDIEAGCKALQIPGIFHPGVNVEADWGQICYYANGSFDLEGDVTLEGKKPHIVSFGCHRKNAFSDLYSSVGPEGTFEEWTYTTSYGVDVLMVLDHGGVRGNASMYVEHGEYVYVFNITEFDDMPLPDKAGMEAYAEAFDFTVQPQRVSVENLEAAEGRRNAADKAFAEEHEKKMHSFNVQGYDARIKFQMETSTHPNQLGFAVMDLNGDGTEDLLVGENGYIRAAYTKIDDGTQHMMPLSITYTGMLSISDSYLDNIGDRTTGNYSYIYLCEGNRLAYVFDMVGDDVAYFFANVVDGELVWTDRIIYAPGVAYYAGQPWQKYDANLNSEPITEERFYEILNSYVRIPIEFTPISEFPLTDDSPSGIGMPDTVYRSYDELVRARTEWDGDRSDWFYCLTDLDGDGQDEIVWFQGAWKGVMTMSGGRVKVLECGEELTICEGNIIAFTRSYLDGNKTYCYYKLENDNAVLVDYLRYDADKNPNNPWMRSADNSGQDYSMEPISQAEFDAIRAKYTPLNLEMKPVSEYPLG